MGAINNRKMKRLLLIGIMFFGLSCSKDSTPNVCYICTLSDSPDGTKNAPQTVCGEGAENTQFRDNKGNFLASYCHKK